MDISSQLQILTQLLLDGMRPEQQIRATARASPDGSNLVMIPLMADLIAGDHLAETTSLLTYQDLENFGEDGGSET